nr:hypothetical protein [Tanacetum cinerariifolium]
MMALMMKVMNCQRMMLMMRMKGSPQTTKPFEEGETAATPPPSTYRVAARIFVRPHIPMPFCSESEVERLLAILTPSLSPVSPTSYPLPPFLMTLPIFTPLPPPPPIIPPRTRASMVLIIYAVPSIFILAPRSRTPSIGTPPLIPIPLPTTSFPLPLLLPSTSGSESIPEADMPLWKRTRFTTPTGGYEVGESFVVIAARQIRPALTVDDSRRAEDILIGRLRKEMRYFCTLSTTYVQEEENEDDEKSEGDFIDYPTSRGDDGTDDEGDELSKDDADDEDEGQSSDSEGEEEDHLALTVPAPPLHTTPPPSAYRVAARIFVRPHIPMPFCSESEVERLLAILTPSLSLVSPTSYPLPPFLMTLPIFTPLPPPPPIIPPRTRASMIRPALAVDDSRRAEDILIGRLRREMRYFCTLSTTYVQE